MRSATSDAGDGAGAEGLWETTFPGGLWVRRGTDLALVRTNAGYRRLWGGTVGEATSTELMPAGVATVVLADLRRWLGTGSGEWSRVSRVPLGQGDGGGGRRILERAWRVVDRAGVWVHGMSVELPGGLAGGELGDGECLVGLTGEEVRDHDRFLAVMGHELRSPLAGALAMLEILEEEIHGPLTPRQREVVEAVRRSGTGLAEMVGELVELGRLVPPDRGSRARDWDARRLGHAVLLRLQEAARLREVELTMVPTGRPVGLRADSKELVRVLADLVSRLIARASAGETVRLRIEMLDDRREVRFRLEVSGSPGGADSGGGAGESESDARELVVVRRRLRVMGGRLGDLRGSGVKAGWTVDVPEGGPPGSGLVSG